MLLFMMLPGVKHRTILFLSIAMCLSPLFESWSLLVPDVRDLTYHSICQRRIITVAILAQGTLGWCARGPF
jgi:hypothetical protein